VAASGGYPGGYARDLPIDLESPAEREDIPAAAEGGRFSDSSEGRALVFHAGTSRRGGRLLTAGGRVLAVTGVGADAGSARAAAYARLRRISFPGMHYRTDIGSVGSRTSGATASAAPSGARA
jgi:phosphoribosylamine--glycine ligase